jgi:hypothetical protein
LAPARDDVAIAHGISCLLTDRAMASRLASAGRLDVAARFGETRLVNETRELYRSLLAGRIRRVS